MANVRRFRGPTATLVSGLVPVLVVGLAATSGGSTARAQSASPQPLASAPAQTETPGGTVTPLPGHEVFQSRHQVGGQVGGTGIFQLVYRFRALGPVHLEAGAIGADHGGNVSAGVVVGFPVANRWFPYVGFGGGWMWAFGPKTADGCDPKTTTCPIVTDSDTFTYLHARAGIGVAFGTPRKHLVSVDVGAWRGSHVADRSDPTGAEMSTTTAVLMPMAGLSYFYTP